MKITTSFLNEHHFHKVGSINANSNGIHSFILDDKFKPGGEFYSDHGWVYLWVDFFNQTPLEVRYIGKTSQSLSERFKQHKRGFYKGRSGSVTGRGNSVKISNFYMQYPNNRILIYARKSPLESAFGSDSVSLCDFEERALISLFYSNEQNILWNKVIKK